MRSRRLLWCGACAMLWVACDGERVGGSDSGTSPLDAGLLDGAPVDLVDSGALDGGLVDSGQVPVERAGADTVVEAPGAGDGPFADPMRAVNGVRGAGDGAGSTDVFSIGYGEHLVLSWGGRRVRNGDGPDLAVFENAFEFGGGSTFMDPAVVEVSIDAETWVALPHDYTAAEESTYRNDRAVWIGFAGITPVRLHAEDNPVDPFDRPAAGGDHFDLDALSTEGEAGRIRREGFVFLRLSPAPDHTNPDTGAPFVRDAVSNGPDIDGVIARYVDVP